MAYCFRIAILFLLFIAQESHAFHLPQPSATRGSTQQYAFSSSEDYPNFPPAEEYGNTNNNNGDEERLSDEDLMATLSDWDETIPKFNTVHLTGRVGNDPMPKYFEDGKVVVNLSLANQRKYHYMERQQLNLKYGEEETDWYGLEIWGQTAEYVSKFVDKGMRVGVIGSLQEDTWKDKETSEPRNAFKIIVREFEILETRAESEARRGGRRSGSFSSSDSGSYGRGGDGGPSSAGSGGFFDSY